MGEGGKRNRTRKEEVVVCHGRLQSNPEYTGLLQNPKEEKYEMAASHTLKIYLLHFLLNCISKETSAKPQTTGTSSWSMMMSKVIKLPSPTAPVLASFNLKILPPV